MKKQILITGGAGFQGSHLAERLAGLGHSISVLNTPTPEAASNAKRYLKGVANDVIWGSVTDREVIEKSIRGKDVVYHLAARVNVDQSMEEPEQTLTINLLGTYNILEAAKKHGARVIFASSCEVYGTPESTPVTEKAELRPHSPYAASKAAADRLAFSYHKTYGMPVVIIRFFNIYGERQKEGRFGAVIPIFVRKALEGGPVAIFGTGEQTRDYLHISDVINGYAALIDRQDMDGEVVNFATGQGTSIKRIAEYIAGKFGVNVVELPPRHGEVTNLIGDATKAKELLGWQPKVSIWEGIDRYIAWRKNNI